MLEQPTDDPSKDRRIFFDVTDLRSYMIEHNSFTGIQRVVVMLMLEMVKIVGPDRLFLSFLEMETGRYRCIPGTLLVKARGSVQERFAAVLNVQSADDYVRPSLEKYRDRPFRRRLHTAVRDFNAFLDNTKHFRKRRITIEDWRASRPEQSRRLVAHHDFRDSAREGDILFLAGAAWFTDSGKVFREVKETGVRIAVLIHDLIPIVRPEFVASEHPILFHDWLRDTLGYVDLYVANSEATGRDMRTFIEVYGGDAALAVVPLAQDRIPDYAPARIRERRERIHRIAYPQLYDGVAVSEHIRALTKRPFVLVVGSADIRKNHWALAQAWSRLVRHEDIEVPTLVLAGGEGGMNGDCRDFLAATGNLYGWIVRVMRPSDAELDYLYRNCLFTAMPSFYEGWGLPIGESLSYGKTAVVSRTSSMPEVGGDYVEYCDPDSIDSIYRACLRLVEDADHRQALEARIAEADLRGWPEVARGMVETLTTLHALRQPQKRLPAPRKTLLRIARRREKAG